MCRWCAEVVRCESLILQKRNRWRHYTGTYYILYHVQSEKNLLCFGKLGNKVEIILKQRDVMFLTPSKIFEKLNFFYCARLKNQIFANFAG